jgi:hypothetical protein
MEGQVVPLLRDLLSHIISLSATPAVIGVFVTAGLLVVSRDWRLNLIALAVQYLFVALLMTQIIRLEMAAVKALIGWLICLAFYLTEQQAKSLTRASGERADLSFQGWAAARLDGWRRQGISVRAAFGFLATVVVAVAAYAAMSAIPITQVPEEFALACYLLGGLGVLLLGLSQDPLRVGVGILMFLSGFDLFYVALEPSLVVTGLLGSISFVMALGMAYLKTIQAATSEEEADA